jgi:hypothetical protein
MDDKEIEKAADEVAAPFREAMDLYMAKEVKEAFIDGAHFAISELTRWRDPLSEKPEHSCDYLGKFRRVVGAEFYAVETYSERWGFATPWGVSQFVGWRPI